MLFWAIWLSRCMSQDDLSRLPFATHPTLYPAHIEASEVLSSTGPHMAVWKGPQKAADPSLYMQALSPEYGNQVCDLHKGPET